MLLSDRDVHGQPCVAWKRGRGRPHSTWIHQVYPYTGVIVTVGLELWQKTDVSVSCGQSQWLKATAEHEQNTTRCMHNSYDDGIQCSDRCQNIVLTPYE